MLKEGPLVPVNRLELVPISVSHISNTRDAKGIFYKIKHQRVIAV